MAGLPAFKEKQVRIATIALGTITTLLISIVGFQVIASTLVRASDAAPKNLAITEITSASAQVKWATDQETQSVIEYGTTPTSLTFFAPEAVKGKDHAVELNLLSAGSTYYFQVRTGDKTYDNGGVPWTFTTASENKGAVSGTPTPGVSESPNAGQVLSPMPTPAATITAAPARTLSPLPSSTPAAKDTSCVLTEYQHYFNTANGQFDQDNNGTVNFRDWSLCNYKKNGLAPSSVPTLTPTITLTPTATPTPTVTPTPTTT